MEKVLVTGGSGYIGLHCISQLLKEGFSVRTSLRSMDRKKEIQVIDKILKNQILPNLESVPLNIYEICEFSIMALLANTLDHSLATKLNYKLYISPNDVHFVLSDNGIGIFENLNNSLILEDKMDRGLSPKKICSISLVISRKTKILCLFFYL